MHIQDKRLYRMEDKNDERGRKRRRAEYEKERDEQEAKMFAEFMEYIA